MNERPNRVKASVLRGDHKALSAMGSIGGREAAFTRALRKAQFADTLREAANNLENAQVNEDGDVVPPDPVLDPEETEDGEH